MKSFGFKDFFVSKEISLKLPGTYDTTKLREYFFEKLRPVTFEQQKWVYLAENVVLYPRYWALKTICFLNNCKSRVLNINNPYIVPDFDT